MNFIIEDVNIPVFVSDGYVDPIFINDQNNYFETLDELLKACEDYPSSKAKLEEMIDVLAKQRYVSFIN